MPQETYIAKNESKKKVVIPKSILNQHKKHCLNQNLRIFILPNTHLLGQSILLMFTSTVPWPIVHDLTRDCRRTVHATPLYECKNESLMIQTVLPLGKPLMLFKFCVRPECRSGLCKIMHLAIPFETAGSRCSCTSLCHILIEVHEY